jgi:hypothetical protein
MLFVEVEGPGGILSMLLLLHHSGKTPVRECPGGGNGEWQTVATACFNIPYVPFVPCWTFPKLFVLLLYSLTQKDRSFPLLVIILNTIK